MSKLALHIVEDVTKTVLGNEITRMMKPSTRLPDPEGVLANIFGITQALKDKYKKSNIKLPHAKRALWDEDGRDQELGILAPIYGLIWLVTYPLLATIRISTVGVRASISSVHANVFLAGQASADSIKSVCGANCFNCLAFECCSYTYDENRHGWPRCGTTPLSP
jgi:hypothetical protein